MATPFDHYPYTNFHELNLAYFIVHFREIFAQWDQLYSDMLDWKNATDEELAEWKAGVLSEIDAWENELTNTWEVWKLRTELNISGWEQDTLNALNAWKTAFETLFNTTFSNLEDIKDDAEAARDAAIAAQTAAETAAASVAASAAQIETNTDDIEYLKNTLDVVEIKKSFNTNEFEVGTIGADGKNGTGPNFARTIDYIFVNKGDVFYNTSSVVTPRVFIYDTNKALDEVDPYTGWIGTEKYVVPHDGFIRVVYKNTSGIGAAIDNVSTAADSFFVLRNGNAENSDKNLKNISVNKILYHNLEEDHKNLFDKTNVVTGAIKTNGEFDSSYTDWRTTDYMLIDSTKAYELYNFSRKSKRPSNVTVTFYDDKKVRISTISVRDATPDNVTLFMYLENYIIPTNAFYVRLSTQAVFIDALMMVVSTYVPLIYTPYNPQKYYDTNFKRGVAIETFGKQGYNTLDKYTYLPKYPHSSIVSFVAALNEGFDGIWLAVLYTSDGVPVLCHNDDISDFAVNADGTALSEGYKISEHTYTEVSALDFGLPYGEMYEGLRILTLEEGILFAKHYGTKIGIEVEAGETEQRYIDIVNLVKSYGMDKNISVFSYNASNLGIVATALPFAKLYIYGGTTDNEAITKVNAVSSLVTSNNEVGLLFTPFTIDLTAETIATINATGVKMAYTNPASEPATMVNFFEQAKNNYVSMIISRIIPAWKALRDDVVEHMVP